MEDMTLLPSSFGNLNDMNEGNVSNMNMNENFMVMYNAEKYIKEKCHLLCFSQNYDICGFGNEGTNHPAMWAHYAENSNGVCIVIDKEAFFRKNKATKQKIRRHLPSLGCLRMMCYYKIVKR